jgi:UDP-N-acetylglucosamine 2-epimerase (non-hydrolysing)
VTQPVTSPLIDLVAGARPNFMKLAPVARAIADAGELRFRIVHTGQHYDEAMAEVFFRDLGIPKPDVNLGVGSGSHGTQTARIIERYEAHLMSDRPNATVVFGDVNSTAACALAAAKLVVPLAHVEAGLRSFDRTMPEEINRIVTDALADLLLVTEPSGVANLRGEGVPDAKIRLVGNVMIDTLLGQLEKAREHGAARRLGLNGRRYGVLTMHRPSNVDDSVVLGRVLDLFHELSRELPLVFPVHPRTRQAAAKAGVADRIAPGQSNLICVDPLSYLDLLSLTQGAAMVLTDSGGLQEETSILGVPCLTMRENTERPITVERGTSRLVGNDTARIRNAFDEVLRGSWRCGAGIPLWDGKAAMRVAKELSSWLRP